jgi:hypothetical protein
MLALASGASAPVAPSMRNALMVPARSFATYKNDAVRSASLVGLA